MRTRGISSDSGVVPGAEVGKKRSMGQLTAPGAAKKAHTGARAAVKPEQAAAGNSGPGAPPFRGLLPAPPPAFVVPVGSSVPLTSVTPGTCIGIGAAISSGPDPGTSAWPGRGRQARTPVSAGGRCQPARRCARARRQRFNGKQRRSEQQTLSPTPASNDLPHGSISAEVLRGSQPMPGPAEGV